MATTVLPVVICFAASSKSVYVVVPDPSVIVTEAAAPLVHVYVYVPVGLSTGSDTSNPDLVAREKVAPLVQTTVKLLTFSGSGLKLLMLIEVVMVSPVARYFASELGASVAPFPSSVAEPPSVVLGEKTYFAL